MKATSNAMVINISRMDTAAPMKEVSLLPMIEDDTGNFVLATDGYMLAMQIEAAKKKLQNAIDSYLEGALAAIANIQNFVWVRDNKQANLELNRKAYIKQREFFDQELQNFSIESYSSVNYKGEHFSRNEPVRRLTEIHLAVLNEAEQINSPSVAQAKSEYEDLLETFIRDVRSIF